MQKLENGSGSRGVVAVLSVGFLLASAFLAPVAMANTVIASVPAVGAVLSSAPNAVSVTAASSLLPDGNSLMVTDPNGVEVDDGSLTITDTSAVVGLKPLSVTGIYTVAYTLLSPTDAPLSSSYTFLYNAPAVITTPTLAPSPVATVTSGSKKLTNNSSANVAVLVFVGLATVVLIFLLWYAGMIWGQYRKGRKKAARERSSK